MTHGLKRKNNTHHNELGLLISSSCCSFFHYILANIVPSLPPQNLQSYNTSSTTLNVTWSDIPECCVHGILLGYRVRYSVHRRRSDRSVDNNRIKTVPSPTLQHVQLTGLEKFAEYKVQVLGYTRIGDGFASPPFEVTTDEDSTYSSML